MRLGTDHGVERDGILRLWFKVFHIDLSGNGFVAIEDRGGSFAHLYGFHPWTRYIFHAKGLCQSADVGGVLG